LATFSSEENSQSPHTDSPTTSTTNYSQPGLIPYDKVLEYVNANIPILPLGLDGKQDVRNLFTKEELDELRSGTTLSEAEKKEVFYEEPDFFKTSKNIPKVHRLLLLSKFIPREFWTDERIKRQTWHGIAFLTGPTKIPAPSDPNNKVLWGIGVDADDDKTRYVLETIVDELNLKSKTIVQLTPHGGMHVIFFVAVNPNNLQEIDRWRKRALPLKLCKDCKIEIKTMTMQLTLDPSKHRTDSTLGYTRISGSTSSTSSSSNDDNGIRVWESDWLYDLLIARLMERGCLKFTPEQYHEQYKIEAQEDSKYLDDIANRSEDLRKEFTDKEIQKGIEIFLGEDEENKRDNRPFGSIFYPGTKHEILLCWGGYCFFNNITLEHAKLFAQRLDNTTDTPDHPLHLVPIEESYRKGKSNQPIRGKSGLIEAFANAYRYGTNATTLARQRLEKLNCVLDIESKKPRKRKGTGGGAGGRSNNNGDIINQADFACYIRIL
jgi:hypothetical protein